MLLSWPWSPYSRLSAVSSMNTFLSEARCGVSSYSAIPAWAASSAIRGAGIPVMVSPPSGLGSAWALLG